MFLFPVEGMLEVILSYGQMISLFLVLVVFEGVIAAKSETAKPGLVFLLLVFLLAVGVGVGFREITFFGFMLIPVVLCLIAFFIARRTRAKNIASGMKYNQDGLIEEELKKLENDLK